MFLIIKRNIMAFIKHIKAFYCISFFFIYKILGAYEWCIITVKPHNRLTSYSQHTLVRLREWFVVRFGVGRWRHNISSIPMDQLTPYSQHMFVWCSDKFMFFFDPVGGGRVKISTKMSSFVWFWIFRAYRLNNDWNVYIFNFICLL